MTIAEVLTAARYVMDSNGEKTDVLIPLAAWKKTIELLEDQEDNTILQEWLEKRAAGGIEMTSLDTLEQELVAGDLLPG